MLKRIVLSLMFLCCITLNVTAKADSTTNSTVSVQVVDNVCTVSISTGVTNSEGTNATLFIASYFEGKLMKLQPFKITESTKIDYGFECAVNSDTQKTPDDVRVYMWQKDTVKPLSKTEYVFSEKNLASANKNFIDRLPKLKQEIKKKITEEGDIETIVGILNNCIDDVSKNSDKYLITPEFAQRHYSAQMNSARTIYDAMTSEEKKTLKNHVIYDIDPNVSSYFIDYFGLKKWL